MFTQATSAFDNFKRIMPVIKRKANFDGLRKVIGKASHSAIKTFLDLYANHFQIRTVQGITEKLSMKWRFTKIKNSNRWLFERWERNGTGLGLFYDENKNRDDVVDNFFGATGNSKSFDSFGVHGVGETAAYESLKGSDGDSFLACNKQSDDTHVEIFEYDGKEIEAGLKLKVEDAVKSGLPMDEVGERGLYTRYTISSENVAGFNETNFYDILSTEVGSRYGESIKKGLLDFEIEVISDTGEIIFNDTVKPYSFAIDDTEDVHNTTWKPSPRDTKFPQFKMKLFVQPDSDSSKFKNEVRNYDGRVIGLGNIDPDAKNNREKDYGYNDHVMICLRDKDSGHILDWYNMGSRMNKPGGMVELFVGMENTASRPDKSDFMFYCTVTKKTLLLSDLKKSLQDKINKIWKKHDGELPDQKQFLQIIQGEILVHGFKVDDYRRCFEIVGCPNYGNKHFNEEYKYCRTHIGKKTFSDGTIADLYNHDKHIIIELIDGGLDDKHYMKNSNYILHNVDDKGKQLTTKMVTLAKSKEELPFGKNCEFADKWIVKYIKNPSVSPATRHINHDVVDLCWLGLPKVMKSTKIEDR